MSKVEANGRHVCIICGHNHDEEIEGKWEELPEDFKCPVCESPKAEYFMLKN